MTNGDKVREALSRLSDYKIAHCIDLCDVFDDCTECPIGPSCSIKSPDMIKDILEREVEEE